MLAITAIRLVGAADAICAAGGFSRRTVDPLTRALGRIVARHRRARGYSWRRLGDQSGVSGNTVRNLERGERSSRVNIVAAIARGLEMPVWRLFREAEGLAGAMGRRARHPGRT
jgi:DNA-binding XRE family transcriptional regulator